MSAFGLPTLYVLFVWWFSTGVILYLDGLPRRTFRWSLLGATGLFALALYGLASSRSDTSVAGAYVAFTCGLLAWGWHEVAFLMGFVTGPRTTACPPGSVGRRRFVYALQTILYHEVAILLTAALIAVVTWGGANRVGLWTFVILWVMRLSAKLNLFLGVRNLNEEFLPEHLRYLGSFLKTRPMNLLFPVAVTAATVAAALLTRQAVLAESAFEAAGFTFLAVLMGLAVLEHWFMVLPLPVAALWRWGFRSRAGGGDVDGGTVVGAPRTVPAFAAPAGRPIRSGRGARRRGRADAAPVPGGFGARAAFSKKRGRP